MPKLRKTGDRVAYFCPPCDTIHQVRVEGNHAQGPVWGFNGDMDKPTFTPSVRVTWPAGKVSEKCCHHYVTDGRIQYLGDCTHAMAGQTIDLPELPDRYSDENFHWGTP